MKNQFWAGLGSRAVLDYEQLLRVFFYVFRRKKIYFFKYCSVHTKKMHKMKMRKQNKNLQEDLVINFKYAIYSQSIVYFSTEDTSLRDFYIMTLYKTDDIL